MFFAIILSGQDGTLQSFSTVHERFNKSLGRGKYFSESTNIVKKNLRSIFVNRCVFILTVV